MGFRRWLRFPPPPHPEGARTIAASTRHPDEVTTAQNIAGCPAMSVPLCFPEGGVPIGMHFAAARGEEAMLLGLAYQIEEARPWKDRWAPYSIPALR
ncbi:amidase family protein [Pyxidicoccus sp. MSG2]|uniref:amidase family protein n=1 Tax=Pyxidicoccus sp. MSG2 TaxID=2996790 RepID=UPI002270BEC5|nr:amidase family protein [Pyxidicoccus sp. MSG2]MCY1016905.1 amidase family protein [Pyxidicoccus sp. MSG2]